MNDDATKDMFSRRKFLETGSVALAAAGLLSAADAAAQDQKPYPAKDDRSASDPGPGNSPLNGQILIPRGHPPQIPRAWFKHSNIHSLLRTSGRTKADGHGR
jgi:hypothetical protein